MLTGKIPVNTKVESSLYVRVARRKMDVGLWIFLGPAIILLLSITIYPFVYLLYTSFFSENLMNPSAKTFVGLSNFISIVSDQDVIHGFVNTLIFVVCSVGIEMILGLVIALILDNDLPGMKVITILFLIPMSITPIVGALTWKYLLTPPFGWVDYYLQRLGLISSPVVWLGNGTSAMGALIALDAWNWTPFVALILLAGLKSQSADTLEAAAIDGANSVQTFWWITLPFLKRFLLIALALRLIDAFKSFNGVYGLTGGGPGNSTLLMSLVVYRKALESFQVGYAAAIAFLFLIILVIVTTPLVGILQREINNS
ncbi:MAG: sugar ABC transporter permease [Alicyclobacillus sp.]|nr:sugar ABC transporter permease [Alicyclobacillus sp.]